MPLPFPLRRFLRAPPPLALQGDAAKVPPDSAPGPVDVIIPVFGAPDELRRCVASLLAHTDLARNRLVPVSDGPQPAATEALLGELARDRPDGVVLLANPERRGFVASVNRGMASSDRDVILLNSDTQVTAGWLEKLQRAAYSAPEIATATPFSNSATICSLPRFLDTNALPAGWSVDALGRLVEERSLRRYPRLPTGVGVCLYVKRKALAGVGLFDEKSFGLGYGEESEFSVRALKAGYAHVLDDATFVFHEGQRSFGRARGERVDSAHRAMARLHPEYMATVARFLRDDPIRPLRERVVAALLPEKRTARPGGPRRVLHIVHGWPPWNSAGTELYAAWLVRRQAVQREVAVLARIADPARGLGDAVELLDHGARVRLLVNNFDQRDPLSRNALRERRFERDLAELLDEQAPDLVHVHHLAGLSFGLCGEVRRRRIPLLYQLQDWWTPCARANLLDAERRLCSGPGAGKCTRCLPLTALPGAPLWNRLLYRERGRRARHALRQADAYVTGSRFLADSYRALGLLRDGDPLHVVPYGVELTAPLPRRPRRPGEPLRCGVIGSLQPHKGLHVAAAAFCAGPGIAPSRAVLHAWGDPAIDPAYTRELLALQAAGAPGAFTLEGRFDEARKGEIFAGLDLLLVPSIGLESFGLVAREAMHHGVPVLASRLGALAEMFVEGEGGGLFTAGAEGELRERIERLVEHPVILAGWAARLPAVQSADRHAEEIEKLYETVLAARRGGARR